MPLADRYTVSKVRVLPGFYAITMRAGYLDHSPPHIPDILPLLIALEGRSSEEPVAAARVRALQDASRTVTHIVPAYSVVSGSQTRVWGWVRRILVEEVYARARVMFPERGNAPDPKREE